MGLNVLKKWVYPDKCIVCGKLLESSGMVQYQYFCHHCESHMMSEGVCKRCGKPYAPAGECLYCDEIPQEVTAIRSLFPYIDFYKESVLRWKYKGVRKYSKGFASLMASELLTKEDFMIDGFIPIPIAPNRYNQRGFNQALDLANELSTLTQIPVYDILRRTKNSKPQSACSKDERRQNIRGTIEVSGTLPITRPKHLALVDDIYTTGSTVLECIQVLNGLNREEELEVFYVLTVCMSI